MRIVRFLMRRVAHAHHEGDTGLSVMEVVVAMAIIGGVMTAASLFFVNGLRNTGNQTKRQAAVAIANQTIEAVQGVAPGALLNGRTTALVSALMATPGASIITAQDQTSSGNTDTVGTYTTPVIQTTGTQGVGSTTYSIRTFIDPCWLTGSATNGNCVAAKAVGTTQMFRVSVDVSYPSSEGISCFGYASTQCDYTTATLIDPTGDPSFNSNISAPTVSAVTPGSVLVGSTTAVTLTGTNFVNGAVVSIASGGGVAGAISSLTATSLTFQLTAASTAGSFALTVLNPDGGRTLSSIVVNAAPTVTSITPTSVNAGSTTTLTLNGSGFQTGATFTVDTGMLASATIVSSAKATLSFTSDGSTGTRTITVRNPDGGLASGTFTVSASTSISSITPAGISCGDGGTAVTIIGTGFRSAVTVSDGGLDSFSGTVLSGSTKITTTMTPSASSYGIRTIKVGNSDGTSASTSYVMTSCPSISSFTPVSPHASANTLFTIGGSGFASGASVDLSYGGSSVFSTNTAYVSASSMQFSYNTNPYKGASAKIRVTVTNPDGQNSQFDVTLSVQ
jgi:hypothetical protein